VARNLFQQEGIIMRSFFALVLMVSLVLGIVQGVARRVSGKW